MYLQRKLLLIITILKNTKIDISFFIIKRSFMSNGFKSYIG